MHGKLEPNGLFAIGADRGGREDRGQVVEARAIIVGQVEKWLNEGPMVGRRNDARLRVAEA